VEYQADLANQVLIFAILAFSLNLLLGYAGQVTIGHAAFAGVGGYAAAKLATAAGLGFAPALVAAVLTAAVVGLIVSVPALRLSLEHLILLTLAVSVVFVTLASSTSALGGAYGILNIPNPDLAGKRFDYPSEYFLLFLPLTILAFLIYWRFVESPFGRVLKAIREDELATRALGKNVFVYKMEAFAVASGLAGLAGAMLAFYTMLVAPAQFNVTQSMLIITMVIFGGMGNPTGPVLGAALLVLATPVLEKNLNIAAEKAGLVRMVVYGAALVLVVQLRPQGLIPERFSLMVVPRWLNRWKRPQTAAQSQAIGAAGNSEPSAALSFLDGYHGSSSSAQPGGRGNNDGTVLAVRGLKKRFGGIEAVAGVDFVLPAGRVTGLVGPNGAGKTTVFSLLTGVIPPDEGSVELRGKDVAGKTPDAIAKMGMVRSFQDVRIFARLTALENVMLATFGHPGETFLGLFTKPVAVRAAEREAKERALKWLSFVGLEGKADLLAGSLAFAEQKLVAIARLLATEADVLLLDEPITGIDPQWATRIGEVIHTLRQLGKTVCIVEHNLRALEQVADHCYFMESGRITAEGSLRDLMSEPRLVSAYFGT